MSTIQHKNFPGIRLRRRGKYLHYVAKGMRGTTHCSTEKEAWAYVRERVMPLLTAVTVDEVATRARKVVSGVDPLLLNLAWERWLSEFGTELSQQRRRAYEQTWTRYADWLKGERIAHLHQVSPTHCRQFIGSLEDLSGRSRQEYYQCIKRIFRDLRQIAGLSINPWDEVPTPTRDTESVEALPQDILQLIGKQVTGMMRDLFIVGIYTGLRESDIVRLRWAPVSQKDMAVDLESNFIYGPMSKTGVSVDIPILPPLAAFFREKGGKAGELVCPELATTYQESPHRLSRKFNAIFEKKLKGKDGEPLEIATTRTIAGRKRAATVYGIKSMRHTFVCVAAMHGVPLPVVQRIVGHLSDRMTRIYTNHAARQDMARHLAALPDLLGLTPTPPPPPPSVQATPADIDALLAQLTGPEHVKSTIRQMVKGHL